MATDKPTGDDASQKGEPAADLSPSDIKQVDQRSAASPKVVHEVIRAQGDEELERSFLALGLSGLAAGVAISASVLAEGAIAAALPPHAPWAGLVTSLGYTVGFVIAVLGRLQLFTETTVTAVLPVATRPTPRNLARLLRLWAIVLAANLCGTALVAWLIADGRIVSAAHREAILMVSAEALGHAPDVIVWLGMPAGFLIASIAWILPNARGSEFWVVMLITWVIGIAGLSHVVAGSAEAFALWFAGRIDGVAAIGGFIAPALAGNILGGTGLFAVLAHGQVRGDSAD